MAPHPDESRFPLRLPLRRSRQSPTRFATLTVGFLYVAAVLLLLPAAIRADGDTGGEGDEDVLEGHSYHGHVFNEGPRQKAYLMGGTGKVHFPITTKSPDAQKFFEQGVGQLHGFWFYEAERSFRTAAFHDPDCAMAYWGMAMANILNHRRFEGFVAEAEKRAPAVTEREQMYIRSLNDPEALTKIMRRFPDDLEAKAFRVMIVGGYHEGGTGQLDRNQYVDKSCREILEIEPMHPCHHYLIHAWDHMKEPYRARSSAEKCGPSAPSIAHMWHMAGGHVYAVLWEYANACFMQEAAARVDHAQMMRDLLLPDQIHLYAHNNEWLTRNLCNVGRVHDAVALAKNMIELPRHPKYNMLRERDEESIDETTQNSEIQHESSYYGRKRLFETLTRFELWNELLALAKTPYIDESSVFTEQTEHYRFVGTAHYRLGNIDEGNRNLAILEERLSEQQKRRQEELDKTGGPGANQGAAVHEARESIDERYRYRLDQLGAAKAQLEAYRDIAVGRYISARDMKRAWYGIAGAALIAAWMLRRRKAFALLVLLAAGGLAGMAYWWNLPIQPARLASKNVDPMYVADRLVEAGDGDRAESIVRGYIAGHRKEVWPLAHLVAVQWRNGNHDAAKETFDELRPLCAACDLDVPVFARLTPIARELGYSEDWRPAPPDPPEGSMRPALDSLGPFRWQPPPAPDWSLKDSDGKEYSLANYKGKPVVVIFYLGAACLHCAQQLAAFAPKSDAFEQAGIAMVAVSTDGADGLKESLKAYGKEFPFPLLSDASKEVFKKYRCFDDFENQPLHGTFLINGDGKILWHDISFEPFMDPEFVLTEAKRLLAQEKVIAQK